MANYKNQYNQEIGQGKSELLTFHSMNWGCDLSIVRFIFDTINFVLDGCDITSSFCITIPLVVDMIPCKSSDDQTIQNCEGNKWDYTFE